MLFDHRADPNRASSDGITPLICAVQQGFSPMLETLLQRGAAIAINAVTKHCKNSAFITFIFACLHGNADCAEALANAGCDMTLRNKDGNTGKQIAERKGRSAHNKLLKRLLKVEKNQMMAKEQPAAQQLGVALMSTAIDMYKAAHHGDTARILSLIEAGATADEMVDVKDENGEATQMTALIQAVGKNRQEAVDLLLDHKADMNCTDSDGRRLHATHDGGAREPYVDARHAAGAGRHHRCGGQVRLERLPHRLLLWQARLRRGPREGWLRHDPAEH